MRIFEAINKTVVIYPGRFHPFHKGHASVYAYLKNKFDTVYITTSNKIDPPKSPFSFAEKRAMMVHAGIPAGVIVQSTQPYRAEEILRNFDPSTTSVAFAVSEKDMEEDPRFSFRPKQDGSPSYFQAMPKDEGTMVGFDTHGYITTVPTLDFTVSGEPMRSATELRQNFAKADDETQKSMITDLYGAYDEDIHNIMRNKIKEHTDAYAQHIMAAESVFADLSTLYEHKQFDTATVLKHANKIVDRINSIPVVETLDYLDPNDAMDSIVAVPGVGTMSIKGLMSNILEKMKELTAMADKGTPTAFRDIRYRMDSNIIGVMMDALVNAFDDIENIRRKGGAKSKSIPKNVFDSVLHMHEAWSAKYKRSINCNNPRGFSQRAHCAGRKKSEDIVENTQDFLYGDCPIFAISLSRMSGLPLKAMLDYSDELDTTVLIHAFVGYKDGLVIDASGVRSIESIEDDYPVEDDPYVTDISEQDLLALGYDGNCPTMSDANKHAKKVLADLKENVEEAVITEYVFQSIPLRVLDNLSSRKDNKPFPIKTGDEPDEVFNVTPEIARKFMNVYYQKEPEVQKAIDKTLNNPRKFIELFTNIMLGKKVSGAVPTDIAPDKLTADINEAGVGIINKQNTTADVKPGETQRQSKKLALGGKPKLLHKSAAKNSDPNTLFNLGLAEIYTPLAIAIMEGGHELPELDEDMAGFLDNLLAKKKTDASPKTAIDQINSQLAKQRKERESELKAKLYKLTRQAMKLPAGSEAQRNVIDVMNPVRKALKLNPIAVTEAFVEPQFDVEWDEAARYPEFVKIGKDAWIELAKTGQAVEITDASDIENTDAADPDSFKSLDSNKQKRALAQLKKDEVEMPIVAVYSDGYKELIAGNTRLTAMMAKDGRATVWQFEVPDQVATLAEAVSQVDIPEDANSDKIYELLLDNIGAGPFDGGCVVVAQALQKIHGGELMALVRNDGTADHAVVQKGNTMYDFDGPGTQEEVISRFEKNEGTKIAEVRKLRMTDLPDAPRNSELAKQIASLMKEPVQEAVSQVDIDQLERFADKMFAKVGIDVEFGRHFMDRVNDERNGKPITPSELTRLFKQTYQRHAKPIAQMGPEQQAVMKDMRTDVNIPFMLQWDADNNELDLIAKTVMRKQDFKTSNREFAVERGGINVPFASGNFASIVPHRALKIKKPTPGRLSYEQPKDNRKRNN